MDKIERLVRVVTHVLDGDQVGATLSEIAETIAGPLSSTHDLLRSMVDTGLLQIDQRKIYRIGPTFVRLAVTAMKQVDILSTARPHLKRLAGSIEHDVYLAVRMGHVVTYVERFPASRRAGLDIRLGDPVPLHSSAVGKLFAAYFRDLEDFALTSDFELLTPRTISSRAGFTAELESVRERSYSMSMEESITGIVGFAAPVLDMTGKLVAAVHVSAFKDYLANADMPRITRESRECAQSIQDSLINQQPSKE